MAELKEQMAPLNAERLRLEGEVNRLTFEAAISPTGDGPIGAALEAARQELETLQAALKPLREEFNRLSRQFWVSKESVQANRYDLSASRYRQVENEEVYYEKPEEIIKRLQVIEDVIVDELKILMEMH
jgi:type I restriction enzyme M protein